MWDDSNRGGQEKEGKGKGRMTRTCRAWFLGTLLAATVGILLWAGWVLGPRYYAQWREHQIKQALAESRGPQSWWPSSWVAEYQERQAMRRVFFQGVDGPNYKAMER